MNNSRMNTATANTTPKTGQPDLVKKINKTTYKVKVHFSTTNKETMQDKIIRMLRNEVGRCDFMALFGAFVGID